MPSLKSILVTQNSDLRKLKFGADRPFKGSSKQPFIQEPLPGVLEDNPNLGLLGGNTDFILRAGTLKRSADDVSRLSKFLVGTGQGAAFIAKQNLLSLSNVRTVNTGANQGIYLPTSTLAQVGVAGVGGHLLKQGINPFRDTKSTGENTDPNFIQRLINNVSDKTELPVYSSALSNIKNPDTNRLVNLKDEKIGRASSNPLDEIIGNGIDLGNLVDGILGFPASSFIEENINSKIQAGKSTNFISSDPTKLISYDGGPGSVLGVGKTTINRVTYSNEGLDFAKKPEFAKYNIASYSALQIASSTSSEMDPRVKTDFRRNLNNKPDSVISDSLDYTRKSIESRVNLGDPGKIKGLSRKNYIKGKIDISTGKEVIADKINALQIYQGFSHTRDGDKINDLVDFRISVINPNSAKNPGDSFRREFLHFRAFINNFQDNMNSEWNSQRYMGRGENMYRYNGFDRTISMGFTAAAQSKGEMMPMYHKLNYLQSIMAPNYTPDGYFFGNIIKLHVGAYLYDVPGVITNLTYTVPEQSPWEIAIGNENETATDKGNIQVMPHIINVDLTFKPIHEFAPKLQNNTYGNVGSGGVKVVEKFGNERFISLSRGDNTGYDTPEGISPNKGKLTPVVKGEQHSIDDAANFSEDTLIQNGYTDG